MEGSDCYYILGAYLERRGKEKKAIDYSTRCMLLPPISDISRTLAGAALIKKGVQPETYRERLQRPPRAAPAAK